MIRDLNEPCGQLPRPCSGQDVSMGNPLESILENQPARKDSEMAHESPGRYKSSTASVDRAGREGICAPLSLDKSRKHF